MSRIHIDSMAPAMTRIHEDSELVCEPHHDESLAEEQPSFAVIPLSDDPAAPRIVRADGAPIRTPGWAIDPPALW